MKNQENSTLYILSCFLVIHCLRSESGVWKRNPDFRMSNKIQIQKTLAWRCCLTQSFEGSISEKRLKIMIRSLCQRTLIVPIEEEDSGNWTEGTTFAIHFVTIHMWVSSFHQLAYIPLDIYHTVLITVTLLWISSNISILNYVNWADLLQVHINFIISLSICILKLQAFYIGPHRIVRYN